MMTEVAQQPPHQNFFNKTPFPEERGEGKNFHEENRL
jgi:hypothetical protein